MKLKKLIKEVSPLTLYKGNKEIEITGIASHSKFVAPGNLFIAKNGATEEGARYIEEAISHGAVAILSEMANPFLKNIAQLIHPDVASIESRIAAAYYGYPSKELLIMGVTGTNGKTTTTYLLKHLLDQLGKPCGLIGTIEYVTGSHRYLAERTTPDALTNQKLLREMRKQKCEAAVMEVSSHGLKQGRVLEISFDVAIFTNLTQDHLDYHGSMEDYADSKGLLFSSLERDKFAIVNYESPWTERMVKNCQAQKITYGFSKEAEVYAHALSFSFLGTTFKVTFAGQTVSFLWNQIGRYNVLNALAAISALLSQNIPLEKISSLFTSFTSVPGRLERVGDKAIFVDYAHTPDALENVLKCLKEIAPGKIITVFGCGGDRDRGKRPLMAKKVEEFSDLAIVTNDNPRTEQPEEICRQTVEGFNFNKFIVELDRRKAIQKAIELAQKEDLILIAGKGHETYQILSHQTIPFDDKQVASEILLEMKHL